jgi:sodium transport system permease protein
MSSAIGTVFRKEVTENLRDRRVIFSALFFGVLFPPLVFAIAMSFASQRAVRNQDQPLRLAVSGAEHAPTLVRFLTENGAEIERTTLTTEQAMSAVRSGDRDVVLLIDEEYSKRLSAGEPAPLDLIVDRANTRTGGDIGRAERLVEAYGSQLASLRLLVRGVSPQVVRPVVVRTLDVATPAARALIIMGMLTYFCLMSMLMGGFYLAIDTTTGERERGSLEPLLALPVHRHELIIGKMLATAAFMATSLLLTLCAFRVALKLIPLEALGISVNFGWPVVFGIFGVMVTFVPLGAGLMTLVASFTRSNREAQSWLSFVLLGPLAPIMVAVLGGTKPSTALMSVPSLSQHLLATNLIRDDVSPPLHYAISAATTLALGALMVWLAVRLYRREAILG